MDPELAFSLRANFEPGQRIVNVLTGKLVGVVPEASATEPTNPTSPRGPCPGEGWVRCGCTCHTSEARHITPCCHEGWIKPFEHMPEPAPTTTNPERVDDPDDPDFGIENNLRKQDRRNRS